MTLRIGQHRQTGRTHTAEALSYDAITANIVNRKSARIVVAYHSGYGHTARLAQALADGAASVAGISCTLCDVQSIDDEGWAGLTDAHAIVFGSPTYMGGPSGAFKMFADASAKVWFTRGWRNKIAGGFTCSLAMSGDKFSTLQYFVTLAMQHGMIWVGTATMPADEPGDPDSANRLGAYIGVMAQADNVPAEESPPPGDLQSASDYGVRIAQFTLGQI